MPDLLSAIISGVLIGLIYALFASSLNIIFGVMRIVNFAHGSFLILGSYIAFWLWDFYGIDPFLSLLVVIPIFFTLGIGLYYLTVPRLLDSDDTEMMSFLAYFGLFIILSAMMRILWGAETRAIRSPYEELLPANITFLGNAYITTRVIGAATAFVILGFLVWFLYRTYYGKAIRAMIQDRAATKFLGIKTHRVSAISFGLAMVVAGISGVLLTLIFPAFSPFEGERYTIIAFSVIVLGGLGDPIGAMIGGVAFAIIEQVTSLFLPLSASPLLAFLILVIVMLVRPEGLFKPQQFRNFKNKLSERYGRKETSKPS